MANQYQPLGTIISSPLNFQELSLVLNEAGVFNPTVSSYSPCDNRSIAGSQLAQRIPWLIRSPDLRGMFLRGLNFMWNDGQQGALAPDFCDLDDNGNPQQRNILSPQMDTVKRHNHAARGIINGSVSGSNNTKDVEGGDEKYNSDPTLGARDVTVVVDFYPSLGGAETRPKNRAIFYYIKIN